MAKAATFSNSTPAPEAVREVEVEVIPPDGRAQGIGADATRPQDPAGTAMSRLVAYLLDDLFRVPGTDLRFGLDPLIGLLPGVGDIASSTGASLILITAAAAGVPRTILAKMCLNVILNAALGAIPGVGDAFSFWFKSNVRNHELLLKHMGRRGEVSTGDKIFVGVLMGGVALTVFLVILAMLGLVNASARFLFGS